MKFKIALISGFLLFVVVAANAQTTETKKITLEDLNAYYTFYPNSVYGLRSMADGEHYTTLESGENHDKVVKYSYETGEQVEVLLDQAQMERLSEENISDYTFSASEDKMLITANRERIYRHSFTADFFIYDLDTKTVKPLSENGRQQLASFSPNGDKVAFFRDNNLFIKELDTDKEIQITHDGQRNAIINGAPDWVYEEEFAFNKAYEWSPDGEYIAYIKFDESRVKEYAITMYAGMYPTNEENVLYPDQYVYKYPKAGEDNSIVSVHIYNVKRNKTETVDLGAETDIYIPRIRWTQDPEKLAIMRMNRLQNQLEILVADAKSAETSLLYKENNERYIEESQLDNIVFLDDGKHFITTSEQDGYRHIYLYDMEGNLVNQITKGEWDVMDYIGYDASKKTVYYTSVEESPLRRDVYSIKIDGTKKKKLSERSGTNRAVFSNGFKYYINYFSSATRPTLVTLHNAKGEQVRVLEDNNELISLLEMYDYRPKEFFSFTTSEDVELNGWIIKPADFDSTKSYPLVMTQYSGPASQEVRDQWEFGWERYLAQQGYVVACVDGRGTGARGEEFRKMTYLNLGKYETIDQIEAAKYLGAKDYIDSERIAMWGWSYGGFMTLLCMTKGADYFKTGIAVAPVTSWRYYDNIYTERFMRKPQDNQAGYDENAPINFVDKLQGNLLVVHGTADDNVHFQNTMEFIEAMVQANKQFEVQPYNNRNHGIYGRFTRLHLFTRMSNFLEKNL